MQILKKMKRKKWEKNKVIEKSDWFHSKLIRASFYLLQFIYEWFPIPWYLDTPGKFVSIQSAFNSMLVVSSPALQGRHLPILSFVFLSLLGSRAAPWLTDQAALFKLGHTSVSSLHRSAFDRSAFEFCHPLLGKWWLTFSISLFYRRKSNILFKYFSFSCRVLEYLLVACQDISCFP